MTGILIGDDEATEYASFLASDGLYPLKLFELWVMESLKDLQQ